MVGDKAYRLLRSMGVEKVKTLQQMPVELLEAAMGRNGVAIWEKSQWRDRSPVEQYSEQKSISSEHTFDQDTIDIHMLEAMLVSADRRAFVPYAYRAGAVILCDP